ncbi:F-box protein At5g51370-like isoform X1 [Cynara cardunculus var. scolymus]|uniref:F-box protein At5g51370-like isoform X1 n=1 Tax=Cynara cardunculus var. scolymus TaxID=59895 RepID=UPI000D627102|nr:F-box protein At5g51370-like isoform X1 [Cynara cardunculus var. scolymus]
MSSCSVENQNPNHSSPLNWLKNKKAALDHVVFSTIRRRSLYRKPPSTPKSPRLPADHLTGLVSPTYQQTHHNEPLLSDSPQILTSHDFISLLSDETLLQILSRLPQESTSLVSKSWLNLQGRLVRSLRVFDWSFLTSGRMFLRFPNLIDVDLLHASLVSSSRTKIWGLSFPHLFGPFSVDSDIFLSENHTLLPVDQVDFGLKALASVYPNLQRLVVVNCSEIGLLDVAEGCQTLQELVLHRCHDQVLRGIAAFRNLQILKLIGSVDGFYCSLVSDIGLTILAQGCKRLVKLELRGCEGSYDGIQAIGQCCHMLEELTFCDHRMDDGWLSALSYCKNLKILRLVSCKRIDQSPGLDEHLGCCRMLEILHLERCQLKEKQSLRALFLVSQSVRELVVKNCWGLKDGMFLNANLCRRLKMVSLEGCLRLTTEGLESVLVSLKELESLRVISCNNIKEDEVSPALSTLFSGLKNLKWTPDNTSLLSTNLSGSGMGKRGGKFFKKLQILNT